MSEKKRRQNNKSMLRSIIPPRGGPRTPVSHPAGSGSWADRRHLSCKAAVSVLGSAEGQLSNLICDLPAASLHPM